MIEQYVVDLAKQMDARPVVEQDLGPPNHHSGKWNFYRCPFPDHSDDTPSFGVAEDGYKCFGTCGRFGDVIDWCKEYRQESFEQAVLRLTGKEKIDPEEAAERAARRAERVEKELERKIQEAQKTLEELRHAQTWLKYHYNAGARGRKLWELRGVPDYFQDFWQLGYCEDYTLWRNEAGQWVDWWHTPTLAIPVWGYDWQINNVKHRLLDEPEDGGKYRYERSGVPAAPFICLPDKRDGHLFLAEGEIKAMVTFATIDSDKIQVAGLPAVRPDNDLLESFKDYEPIYMCLDPDAYQPMNRTGETPAEKVINALGKDRTRIVELPDKVDDLINAGVLDKDRLRGILKRARRP